MKTICQLLFLLTILSTACSKYDADLVENNPLLNEFNTPQKTLPFNEIKPEHIVPAADITFKNLQKELKRVSKLKEAPSFENTILPIELQYDKILTIILYAGNLNSANNNDEIQEAMQKIQSKISIEVGKLFFNKKLIKRVERVYNDREKLATVNQKAATEKVYRMFEDFIELGFFKKLKYVLLEVKGSKLAGKFSKNLLDEANLYELHITNSTELAGIPQTAIDAAAETAKEKGKGGWIFTLHQPSLTPVLRYAQNREIREKIYKAFVARGNHNNDLDNKKLIKQTIEMRIRTSKLLGYETYAHFALKERMASNPETINRFLQDLTKAVKPFAEKDMQEVKAYMVKEGNQGEPQHWDYGYYITKLKEERYGFNDEDTRPYFALNSVKQGIFDLATTLYGITFKSNSNIQVYQEDVEAFEVFDNDNNLLGVLYLDFFPREGKRAGAWNTIFVNQKIRNGKNIRPHTSIVTNFNKPTKDKPALLTFNEMNTFLHEFGHALHMLFGQVDYSLIGSMNVYWDFVELPSQIMENWAVEKSWLNQWAKHYETGEMIPDELVDKIIASRNYFSGYNEFRQLKRDNLDMAWHLLNKFPEEGVKAFEVEATKDYTIIPSLDEACISTAFSHIFAGGYAAGYYGYHWANVLDADAFVLFKQNGIFDKATATSFRKNILEKGASEHPMILYKNFRGNKPSIDAMLIRRGLKEI